MKAAAFGNLFAISKRLAPPGCLHALPFTLHQILPHRLIHTVYTRLNWLNESPTSNHRIDRLEIDVRITQLLEIISFRYSN